MTVTLDTYGHLLPSLDEALITGLEERYRTVVSERSRSSQRSGLPSRPLGASA